ncbi:abortive infection family protein [Pasteurella multocida]|nr:abortive infection family protein [Pasteurella multocida]
MEKLLEYLENTSDKYNLIVTVKAIMASYQHQDAGIVIGQCKSLIEGLAKSILDEYNQSYKGDETFPKLTKLAIQALFPKNNPKFTDNDAFKAVQQMSTSLMNAVDSFSSGLAKLRNDYCPFAHGRSINQQPLPMQMAEFVMFQSSALVKFILHLIEESKIFIEKPLDINSEECLDFNEYLNSNYSSIELNGDTYFPHEILFYVKKESYIDLYKSRLEDKQENEQWGV